MSISAVRLVSMKRADVNDVTANGEPTGALWSLSKRRPHTFAIPRRLDTNTAVIPMYRTKWLSVKPATTAGTYGYAPIVVPRSIWPACTATTSGFR
jgi:hypothetical protein